MEHCRPIIIIIMLVVSENMNMNASTLQMMVSMLNFGLMEEVNSVQPKLLLGLTACIHTCMNVQTSIGFVCDAKKFHQLNH